MNLSSDGVGFAVRRDTIAREEVVGAADELPDQARVSLHGGAGQVGGGRQGIINSPVSIPFRTLSVTRSRPTLSLG